MPRQRTVRRLAPLVAALALLAAPAAAHAAPFDGTGVWIWQLARSDGGSVDGIAARAQASGVKTVFVKSADGARWWPQFSAGLVQALHARGLQVCAWQYLYGRQPVAEAVLGARAQAAGADCLVLDVESQYAGRYTAAKTFLGALRSRVGADYPSASRRFPT